MKQKLLEMLLLLVPLLIPCQVWSQTVNGLRVIERLPDGKYVTRMVKNSPSSRKAVRKRLPAKVEDGTTFTAKTVEGIEMKFKVISVQKKTCQVGWHDAESYSTSSDDACVANWETSGKVTIPGTVEGYTVTTIARGAFYWCPYITSVSIPQTVTTIEDHSFSDCEKLTSLEIPKSVVSIGEYAFSGNYFTSMKVETGNPVYDSRNSCNGVVESKSNSLIAGCSSTFIPQTVTAIGQGAFYGSHIQKIVIPKNVTWMGYQSFDYCRDLQTISVEQGNPTYDSRNDCNAVIMTSTNELVWGSASTLIPNGIVTIGDGAFQGRNIESIDIPSSVERIGRSAFRMCYSLESVSLPQGITSIESCAFEECSAMQTVYSAIAVPFPIEADVFGYYDWENGVNKYPSTLYVPIGTKSLYQTTASWNKFENIIETDKLPVPQQDNTKSQTLVVLDPLGNDISGQVTIVWSDANGKNLGTGSTISGLSEDTRLYYSIILDSQLGTRYREVVNGGGNTPDDGQLTCRLESIGTITLQGRVSALNVDKANITVSVLQKLNGRYEQRFTARVNEQGLFALEVLDDETDITVAGEGYLNATLHRGGFNGNGNLGVIELSLISGCSAAATIVLQRAVEAGGEAENTIWTDGLGNVEFALYNITRGTSITDFAVQNSSVIIKNGAGAGDEIRVEARSKQGLFAASSTTFTVKEHDSSFSLTVRELGGIDAVYATSRNSSASGYLYDANGVLVSKGNFDGETLSLRHLADGSYTLVSIGNSLLLGSLTNIREFAAIGLTEGTDYVTTQVNVEKGVLTKVNIAEIPQLDDTRFYYTTGNTYFTADKSSVTAGNYLTLSAHVDFKPEYADKVEAVTLSVRLPEGCKMVDNSVIANRKAVPYTLDGDRLSMQLGKEQFESQVRFCIIPAQNKTYTLTAMAAFNVGGEVAQPVGTAQFEVKGLTLEAPTVSASPKITVGGTAVGHSEVSIYDGDVLIGKTRSLANGQWSTECELYNPYNHSFHVIYAKIASEKGLELTSETRQVEYSKSEVVAEKVTMIYYNPEFDKNYNIIFDLVKGTATPSSYYYFPYKNWPNWWQTRETEPKDFTFLASFNINDSSVVKNVSVKVLNSDGTVRTLPTTYDGSKKCWVATTKYSSTSRVPNNVTVDYETVVKYSDEDREASLKEQASALASSAAFIGNFFDEKIEMTLVEEDDDHVLFECKAGQGASPLYYRIENMDYLAADNMMKTRQFVYVESEAGCIGTYTENSDNGITVYVVDVQNNAASKMSLYSNVAAGTRAKASAKAKVTEAAIKALQESVGTGEFLDGALEHLGNLADLLTGIKEYWSVNGDFNNLCNIILKYSDNLELINKRTFDMTLAKCPDGSYRLSQTDMDKYYKAIRATQDVESAFRDQYYECLQEYKSKLAGSVLTYAATLGLGKAIGVLGKTAKFVNSKMNLWFYNNLNKHFSSYVFRTTSAKILTSVIGAGIGKSVGWGLDKLDEIFSYKDFESVKDRTLSWASGEYSGLLQNYLDMQKGIQASYKKCEKEPAGEENDKQADESDKRQFKGKGTRDIQDPSGYVYEAVLSNRLEGVTATCYQKVQGEDENGAAKEEAVIWNAADYSQVNPQQTDNTGFYRWDVPQGMWQVKYEKEGYETAYSDWLPVPPPQLDVNVGMKQSTPPAVKPMRGTESGITIELTKYMRPATMTAGNITVTRNGVDEKGSIELQNSEQAPLGGDTFVSKVTFVPQSHFKTSDVVVVTVRKDVESYCGVQMTADHVETVKIESELRNIAVDEEINVDYQGLKELTIAVLPREAAAGRTLLVKNSSAMIASVSASELTLDEYGAATLTLGGELPGGTTLTFSVEGTDLASTSKVKVIAGRELVAAPVASVRSGEAVEGGTLVTFSCETEGATIYYTTDGSCPCDETSRRKYEGPILVASSITVKAIAVKEGLDDSDVATFVYFLDRKSMGDVDLNGVVDVADMALTVDQVLKGALLEEATFERMDMNVDGHVDVGDVILIVKKILDGGGVVNIPAKARGEAQTTDLTQFTAMQLTVGATSGMTISDIRLAGINGKTHQLMYRKMPDGSYAVVVFSLHNARFSQVDGSMLNVIAEGDGDITTQQVLLTTPDGVRCLIDSLPDSQVTGVGRIAADGVSSADVYDLRGRRVLTAGEALDRLPQGVYVMNGRKVIK